MLDPSDVDLGQLRAALDDRTPGMTWWIDPRSGTVASRMDGVPTTEDPRAAGWLFITPTESHVSYREMAEFVTTVQNRRAADLLDRAISGRGAFRRFKDTLFEFPELRDRWFRFRDARGRRRALRWLGSAGLVERSAAEAAAAGYPDPEQDDEDLPAAVAVDLGMLYGDRIRQVLVTGAWAGSADPGDRDLELLVVLDEVRSAGAELARMDPVLWRHTLRSGTCVLAHPLTASALAAVGTPALASATDTAVLLA